MTNGLYGYYDTEKEYVAYIGKDADIGNDARHKTHTRPSQYDKQAINRVIQKNPDRYTYFRFIEGEYNDETLNELEKEAIRLFKTYKYDYPERNVFNFQKGGEGGFAGRQHSPNWKQEDYTVVKNGMDRDKQQYQILGRYGKVIKRSINKKKLEQLTNKLNKKEITEEEVKNLRLHDTKAHHNPSWRNENYSVVKYGTNRGNKQYAIMGRYGKRIKYSINKEALEKLTNKLNKEEITEEEVKNLKLYDAIKAHTKYDIWDVSCCYYCIGHMLNNNGGDKPRRCFRYKYKGHKLPIGYFNEFVTCQVIDSIVQEEVKKCKHEN